MQQNKNNSAPWLFSCRGLNCKVLKTYRAYYLLNHSPDGRVILCEQCYLKNKQDAIFIPNYLKELETIQGLSRDLHVEQLCNNFHLFSFKNQEALTFLQLYISHQDILRKKTYFSNQVFQIFYLYRHVFSSILKKPIQDELIHHFNDLLSRMQKYKLPVEINQNSLKKIVMQEENLQGLKIVHNYLIQIYEHKIYVQKLPKLQIVFSKVISNVFNRELQFRYSENLQSLIIFNCGEITFVSLNQVPQVQSLEIEFFHIVDVAIAKDILIILANANTLLISNALKLNQIYDKSLTLYNVNKQLLYSKHLNSTKSFYNQKVLNFHLFELNVRKILTEEWPQEHESNFEFSQLAVLNQNMFHSFTFLLSENLIIEKLEIFLIGQGKKKTIFHRSKPLSRQSIQKDELNSNIIIHEPSRTITLSIYLGNTFQINFQCNKIVRQINLHRSSCKQPQQYYNGRWMIYYDEEQVTVYDLATGGIEFELGGKESYEIFTKKHKIIKREDNYFLLCNHQQ